jgi:hypothetical protein
LSSAGRTRKRRRPRRGRKKKRVNTRR